MDGEHQKRSKLRWIWKVPLVMAVFICMAIVGLIAGGLLFIWSVPFVEEMMKP